MTRAFIVKIDVEDTTMLQQTAMDIDDDLTSKGYLVVSVAPWRGHGQVATPPPVISTAPLPPTL